MVQHELSVKELLRDLYTYFHIQVDSPSTAEKKPVKASTIARDVVKKAKPVKIRKYTDVDDTPIDADTLKELQELREQHLKAARLSTVRSTQSSKLSKN